MAPELAWAASVASDNACNSPYGGTNWSNGQNGGTGFGAWSLFQSGSGTSSFFTASSSGINASCGEAWGEFAGVGDGDDLPVDTAPVAQQRSQFIGGPRRVKNFPMRIDHQGGTGRENDIDGKRLVVRLAHQIGEGVSTWTWVPIARERKAATSRRPQSGPPSGYVARPGGWV